MKAEENIFENIRQRRISWGIPSFSEVAKEAKNTEFFEN